VEFLTACFTEEVGPFHRPLKSLQHAEAIVIVETAGSDNGLLTDDSLTFHMLHVAVGVNDDPVSAQKLHRFVGVVGNPDEVCEDELPFDKIRLPIKIHGMCGDCDSTGGCSIRTHANLVLKCQVQDTARIDANQQSESLLDPSGGPYRHVH